MSNPVGHESQSVILTRTFVLLFAMNRRFISQVKTKAVKTKKHFGAPLPIELVDRFRTECSRQGRRRSYVIGMVMSKFLALPDVERDEICKPNGN
jgi:hypothetical protein